MERHGERNIKYWDRRTAVYWVPCISKLSKRRNIPEDTKKEVERIKNTGGSWLAEDSWKEQFDWLKGPTWPRAFWHPNETDYWSIILRFCIILRNTPYMGASFQYLLVAQAGSWGSLTHIHALKYVYIHRFSEYKWCIMDFSLAWVQRRYINGI